MECRKTRQIIYRFLALLCMFLFWSATAQVTCIQDHFKDGAGTRLGFSPTQVENLVYQIAVAIGTPPNTIRVFDCPNNDKVQSFYEPIESPQPISMGNYIIYDPVWMREILGLDIEGKAGSRGRGEAVVLFGHELGHFRNSHFTDRANIGRLKQETEADNFSGCAANVMGIKWEIVKGFLERVRPDVDDIYPSREHSITAALSGFDRCNGIHPVGPPSRLLAAELQNAIIGDSAVSIQDLIARGAKPDTFLGANTPAVVFAWENAKYRAFWTLVDNGASLPKTPLFDDLIVNLVEDPETPPERLRIAMKAGAPVSSGRFNRKPACVASRQIFRTILREAGYVCG